MRRKDRCGPGMTNSDEDECLSSSEEEVTAASECCKRAEKSPAGLTANKSQVKRENATTADKQRGDFTAGFLSEPARTSRHPESIAEGRGVFIRETEMFPDLGLVKTGPCSKSEFPQKYLISSDNPSVFFGFFAAGRPFKAKSTQRAPAPRDHSLW